MNQPLMPMATAVWLVDNTALSFNQIAGFCGLHELEVQGIADEQIAINIVGLDPVSNGQLTKAEIQRCEADSLGDLKMSVDKVPAKIRSGGAKYTPVSKRQDKPDAISWLIRHHPELKDPQISKLIGTTKPTIEAIRTRTHWNISQIKPIDPVLLGLCKQSELDVIVIKAAEIKAKEEAAAEKLADTATINKAVD